MLIVSHFNDQFIKGYKFLSVNKKSNVIVLESEWRQCKICACRLHVYPCNETTLEKWFYFLALIVGAFCRCSQNTAREHDLAVVRMKTHKKIAVTSFYCRS